MSKYIASLTLILAIVFSAASVFAQRTTGDMRGAITDANGAAIPGATVTLTGKNVGLGRSVVSDDQGVFRVPQIPPGNYTVTVAAVSGFADQSKDNVQILSNNVTTADFTMVPTVSATVDATGQGYLVGQSETKSQTTLTAGQIETLPKGTGFASLFKYAVGVRAEALSGQYTVNGASGSENSFLIDGQETQNYRNGLLNSNNDIPYQAVQEIQVKTSGFEAEFGGATGGVFSAITKSGANAFHGEFGTQLSTQSLNAGPRPIPALTNSTSIASAPSIATTGQYLEFLPQNRDSGTNIFPTASIGGPIVKNRLWFYAIHSPRIVNVTRTTNFIQGFGATRTTRVLSPSLIAIGATPSQTVTERTTYNYSSVRFDASPVDSLRLTSSFTWNPIVDKHPLLGGTYVNGSPSSAVLNGTLYQGAGLAQLQGGRQNSNNFRGEAIWTAGRGLIVDVRYSRGFMNQKLGSYGIPSDPRIICQSVPSQYIAQAGCAQGFSNISSNENVFKDVSIRDTWDASLTYVFKGLGTHEVKGGYQRNKIYNDVSTGNVFGSGGQGRTYLYYGRGLTGIDCFSIYVQWAPNCPANGRFYPLPTLPTGVSVIGSGVNYQFGTNGEATDTVDSVFLQDKWQPFRRLTLNLGVRLEKEQFPTFNTTHIDLNWDWKDKVAPRVGIAYALTGDGKTKVAGMWGKYFDRLKFSVPQNAFGGQFYHVSYFYITSDRPNYSYYTVANLHGSYAFPSGGQCPIIPTSPNGYVCDQDYRVAANVSGANSLSSGAVDPDLKPYEQTETTFEFQRELFRSTVLTARYIRRELDHVIEDVGIPGPLGDAYIIGNPGEGLAAETARSLGYNKVAVPKRDYNAFQAELDTRYLKNLSLNFNYTWSRLAGNYSGLANPDELQAGGTPRMDPNLSRAFSAPWVGFTASGQPDDGALPLDRTHVFKAWGTYTFDWLRSGMNSTDLSFFTTIESGTPRTTFVNIFGVPIPETKRGDLGRTPTFSQTDLNLTHRIKFGHENRYAVALNFNVINAFNQNTVLVFDQNKTSGYWALSEGSVVTGGDTAAATNVLTSTGVLAQYAAAEQTVCAGFSICGAGVARNLAFQTPLAWQEPRSVRFGFRFIF